MESPSAELSPASIPLARARRSSGGALLLFSATLLFSALLLFTVQPLFAKMVLPRLGGSPAVWSVVMVFFQGVLLAGYAYTHLLVRLAPGWMGLAVHAAVTLLAGAWLPLGIAPGFEVAPAEGPSWWLLSLLASSLGVPFFVAAANAPLLQAWFSRTGHPRAADPYFLYGASNIGSFLALLSYPALIEPLFTLRLQAGLWTGGFLLLCVAVLTCGVIACRSPGAVVPDRPQALSKSRTRVSWGLRLKWIGLAFVPSAFLVAVTAHISTNVAAAPLLWVLPLAIFLLTFVVAFQQQPILPHRTMQLMLPFAATAAAAAYFLPLLGGLPDLALNLAVLFVLALTWHGELVANRPGADRLTEFYLCMSAGGVLGGAFTSLLAPVLFNGITEFPLLLAASVFIVPEVRALLRRPVGIAAAGLAVVSISFLGLRSEVEYRERNFFGVIQTETTPDGRFRTLVHGTTLHGAERINDLAEGARPQPLTYYAPGGPLANAIGLRRMRTQPESLSVGIVGLGAGSLACYARPGDDWRFYEIDPSVIRIARDPRAFTFLSSCTPEAPIHRGDARLTLAGEAGQRFDALVIDAFSSDSIPVHLLTREALRLYGERVTPDGVILLHISNRFMELGSVVASTAAAEGLTAVRFVHERSEADERERLWTSSEVVALADDAKHLDAYLAAGWHLLKPDPARPVEAWTDDYSNVVAAILRKQGLR